jgi:cation/acetate symporter
MNALKRCLLGLVLFGAATQAVAGSHSAEQSLHVDHWTLTAVFAVCVVVALMIIKLATFKTRFAANAHGVGASMSSFQNGLAMSGSYLSAASLLGLAALVMANGYAGLVCVTGFLAGWPLMVFLLAERLRNLGRFTFADVLAYRFRPSPVRVFAACSTLVVTVFYLAAQMVGVGQLVRLLFGLEYWMAVTIAGALMLAYARLGGMIATTWMAIVKMALLLVGVLFMAFMVLLKSGFNIERLFAKAADARHLAFAPDGASFMATSLLPTDTVSVISLGVALMFGAIGLPHVLMRFFSVPDAQEARQAASWATLWNACFYLLSIVIVFGVIGFVFEAPAFLAAERLKGAENMAVIYLAYAVGGEVFMGFIAAVAFMTLLAVTAALVLAGASAVSHDLYATVFKKGKANPRAELRVAHGATLCLGALAALLSLVCENLNIAVMVSLVFAIAASANFPVLLLSIFWKNCTTRGVVIGGGIGLVGAVTLTLLSKPVWVDVLHHDMALFPYASPALFSMSAAFLGVWFFSVTDKSERATQERAAFVAQQIRSETGLGG